MANWNDPCHKIQDALRLNVDKSFRPRNLTRANCNMVFPLRYVANVMESAWNVPRLWRVGKEETRSKGARPFQIFQISPGLGMSWCRSKEQWNSMAEIPL